jgi:hypothetical protein
LILFLILHRDNLSSNPGSDQIYPNPYLSARDTSPLDRAGRTTGPNSNSSTGGQYPFNASNSTSVPNTANTAGNVINSKVLDRLASLEAQMASWGDSGPLANKLEQRLGAMDAAIDNIRKSVC